TPARDAIAPTRHRGDAVSGERQGGRSRRICYNAGRSSSSGTVTPSHGDPIMKRSIGTPLALFGLLLALAMVCATSAQGPKLDVPAADPATPPPATTAPHVSSPSPRGGPSPS